MVGFDSDDIELCAGLLDGTKVGLPIGFPVCGSLETLGGTAGNGISTLAPGAGVGTMVGDALGASEDKEMLTCPVDSSRMGFAPSISDSPGSCDPAVPGLSTDTSA